MRDVAVRHDTTVDGVRHIWSGLCLLVLGLLLSGSVRAAVDIAALERAPVPLAPHLEYLRTGPDATLASVRQLPDSAWQIHKDRFGFSSQSLWARVHVQGAAQVKTPYYLRLNFPHLDYVDVYVLRQQETLAHFRTGDRLPFSSRPVERLIFLFPMEQRFGDHFFIYVRVQSEGTLTVPMDFITRDQFIRENYLFTLWTGMFYGMLLIMLVYNGIILGIVRQRAYVYYLVYMIAMGALQLAILGMAFQFFWPDNPQLNAYVIPLLSALMPLTAIVFVASFIDIFTIGSRAEQWLIRAFIAVFAVQALASFFVPYGLAIASSQAVGMAAVVLGFYLGIKYWRRGVKSARIFSIAWFSHLLFISWYLLDAIGLIDAGAWGQQALSIGAALEMALLSIAFADRVNEEKALRLHAQDDLLRTQGELLATQIRMNEDLEQRVRVRTEELEHANRQLQQISMTDALTGLRNRRYFEDVFAVEYQRAFREKRWLALMMIDIDHFKRLNDRYGHPFGDLCLQVAGRIIQDCLQRPSDLAARYGGEEFVVLLPGTGLEGALTIANGIYERFAATEVVSEGMRYTMTVSMGLVSQASGPLAQACV